MLNTIGDVVLPTRVRNRFALERIFTLDDLLARTAADVLRIPQLGRGSYNTIKHALGKSGLALKGDTPALQPIDKAVADKALAEAAVLVLKDDIYELRVELGRCKKLLGQAMERSERPTPSWEAHDAIDAAVGKAHGEYRRLAGKLYWKRKRDYAL
jgi:hypothetical protein